MPVSGVAVFYATAGGVLLWSGFKGQTLAQTVKAVTGGNSAALAAQGGEGITTTADVASAASGSPGTPVSVPANGSTYSYGQLKSLWMLVGGPPSLAPTMAAIALAESGGRSNAYNASGASGLWQILGAVNPADQAHLFNPVVNAREALLKYRTQGLGAWVTYTDGSYQKFLQG